VNSKSILISFNLIAVIGTILLLIFIYLSVQQLHIAVSGLQISMGIASDSNKKHLTTQLVQMEQLAAEQKFAQVHIYFNHVMGKMPGNLSALEKYHHLILAAAKQDQNNGLNLINIAYNLLHNQVANINPQHLDNLIIMLDELDALRIDIEQQLIATSEQNVIAVVSSILVDVDNLLKNKPTDVNSQLNLFREKLTLLHEIRANHAQPTEQLENIIQKLQFAIAQAEKQQIANNLQNQFISIINQVKTENYTEVENGNLLLYQLTIADSILNQLVLLSVNIELDKSQLIEFSRQLDAAKQDIAHAQSALLWAEIQQIIPNEVKAEKAQDNIDKLIQARQILATKAMNMTAIEFIEQAKLLQNELEIQLAEWQQEQIRSYNIWAVNNIHKLYRNYSGELGIRGDANKVYAGLITYMSNIDVRYLQPAALNSYNDIFQKFYAKLGDEQKIDLSARMLTAIKRPLSYF
jgi:hypothetical protein